MKDDGILYITVPHTGKGLFLNHVRRWLGFRPEDYGHVREGYSLKELQEKLGKAGFVVTAPRRSADFLAKGLSLVLILPIFLF